jgi:hypothetical protein
LVGREVGCECEWQPELCRELCAERARAEQPDRDVEASARDGANRLIGRRWAKVSKQLLDVLGKRVGAVVVAAKRPHGALIGARRPAESEIDASGKECGEGAELFGDDERRVIREHDASRSNANARGARRDVSDHHRRRRTRDAWHVVMLGEPEAVVAQLLGVACQLERIAKGARCVAAGDDWREIENRERDHQKEYDRRTRRSPTASRDRYLIFAPLMC